MLAKPESDRSGRAEFAAGMILDNAALNEWSASNRAVVEKLAEIKAALYHNSDTMKDHQHVMSSLAHQIERLRDRME